MINVVSKVKREIRRDQIVKATLRIIAKKGMNSLTTATIAKEVGISEANLYRHFKNKQEIIYETIETIGRGLSTNVEKVFKYDLSPLVKLEKVFLLHLRYIEKNEGIPRLAFSDEIHMGEKEIKERLLSFINSYTDKLSILIKEGQKTGLIKEDIKPKSAALMIIGIVQVTVLRWSLNDFSFSLLTEGKKLWLNFVECLIRK
jgi:AcrR family transcriptional regulator